METTTQELFLKIFRNLFLNRHIFSQIRILNLHKFKRISTDVRELHKFRTKFTVNLQLNCGSQSDECDEYSGTQVIKKKHTLDDLDDEPQSIKRIFGSKRLDFGLVPGCVPQSVKKLIINQSNSPLSNIIPWAVTSLELRDYYRQLLPGEIINTISKLKMTGITQPLSQGIIPVS